jgi:hypothetical protein
VLTGMKLSKQQQQIADAGIKKLENVESWCVFMLVCIIAVINFNLKIRRELTRREESPGGCAEKIKLREFCILLLLFHKQSTINSIFILVYNGITHAGSCSVQRAQPKRWMSNKSCDRFPRSGTWRASLCRLGRRWRHNWCWILPGITLVWILNPRLLLWSLLKLQMLPINI